MKSTPIRFRRFDLAAQNRDDILGQVFAFRIGLVRKPLEPGSIASADTVRESAPWSADEYAL